MRQPELHDQAFPYRSSERGYHFVQYPEDGGKHISLLMTKQTAQNYANIFGGVVHLHSEAPFRIRHAGKLRAGIAMLASCLVLAFCSYAQAKAFKPLTRAEPIVRMVLQEAANEPFAGMVAVAGTVFDRMEDPRWPSTRKDIVYQPWQYTGMRLRLREYTPVQIEEARAAVEIAASGTRPCGHVYWYHTPAVDPDWRKKVEFRCRIGNHLFYGDKETD